MPLIDDRGRLFGRINLIDGLVAIVILGLIPLAYGAMALFRVPTPTIAAITPTQIPAGEVGTLQLTGADLRPFMLARFNEVPAAAFLIQSPTRAEVKVPALPAGTYDLVLSDEAKDLVRLPGALTVAAPAMPSVVVDLQVTGEFLVGPADAPPLTAGLVMGASASPAATIVSVSPAVEGVRRVKVGPSAYLTVPDESSRRVPAVVRVRCGVVEEDCRVGSVVVEPGATLSLPRGETTVRFSVAEVWPADARVSYPGRAATALVDVRFIADQVVLDTLRPGDRDVPGGQALAEGDRAVLIQIGANRRAVDGNVITEGVLRRSLVVTVPALTFEGRLRVPVVRTAAGWVYKDRPVKVGAPFAFESMAGAAAGWVIRVTVEQVR